MTLTAPIITVKGSNQPASVKMQPQGINRAAESLGVALVKWSRARAAKAVLDHDENDRIVEAHDLKQRRESDALRLTQRMGL